jgi:hypothetical protein
MSEFECGKASSALTLSTNYTHFHIKSIPVPTLT